MLELLAPAGNLECANAAIMSGADAIYLGLGSFSARASAGNFDVQSFQDTIRLAHILGVKVYLAMNTIVKNEELDEFIHTAVTAWNLGADAIIMQDMLLGKALHKKYPQIVLHLSTQAGVCNIYGAKLAKEYGFSRVILARETPLAEIKEIAAFIETEVFVQGALCTCFSGQCYLSSFAGGNSGNRGRCKQPCRKLYSINRDGYDEKSYALSLSDLCVGEEIHKLIDAGVVSFKIEGRMRRKEYVSAAVSYYRTLLDGNASEKNKAKAFSALKRTYNRGNYTKGLSFGQDKRFLSRAVQGHLGEKVGVVKVVNGKYCVESASLCSPNDAFKILRNGKEVGGAVFAKKEGRGFIISSKARLLNGDNVFITTDALLNDALNATQKKRSLPISLIFHEGERAVAQSEGVYLYSKDVLQSANSSPLTAEELKSCFLKTDGLPLEISFDKIDIKGHVFIAKSQLNAFRREFYQVIYQSLTNFNRTEEVSSLFEMPKFSGSNTKTALLVSHASLPKTDINADVCIYKPSRLGETLPDVFLQGDFEKYIYFPAYLTKEDTDSILSYAPFIDGIYAETYAGLAFAKAHNLKLFAGTGFHISNCVSLKELRDENVAYYAISKELETNLQGDLCADNAFVLASGGIKVMDLCYCPFEKTCNRCDKREWYDLTDENGRKFPVRRYQSSLGECRFEIYNCASLVGRGLKNSGKLLDATQWNATDVLLVKDDEDKQKALYTKYTLGHNKNNPLL